MTRSHNSSSNHNRDYNWAELETSIEQFATKSAQNFSGFSDHEKEYIYQNVDNMKNLVATKPLSALSGLKFPEIGGQIADENFNFAAEVMWNENIDQMLKKLQKDKKLQEKIREIQEILSRMIVPHSSSHRYSKKVNDNINSILEN